MVEFAGSVLECDADEVRRALGDAVVGAIDCESRYGNADCVRDEQRSGDGSSVEEAVSVRLHGGGHEDGTVVGFDVERLVDPDLLDVNTLADVNLITGRGSVDCVLDMGKPSVGTLDFVVIDD